MKNLYLLITLFILAACGPSEDEAASEPTPPPMNVFEGTYEGIGLAFVFIWEDMLVLTYEVLTFDGEESIDIDCTLEDPTTTPTMMSCDDGFLNGSVEIDGDTLTISLEGEQEAAVFYRVEE